MRTCAGGAPNVSKPTKCARCTSGDHGNCLGNYGDWSGVITSTRWWERDRKRQLGPEWTCICRHGKKNN